MKSRIYAIGDIHGRFDLLQKLWTTLTSVHFLDLSIDKVVFLGDMIDRGPQSKEVIQFIKELTEKHPNNIIALKGNHEDLALNAVSTRFGHHLELWFINGGDNTVRSYGLAHQQDPEDENYHPVVFHGILMTADHLNWINALPLYHREEGYFFSHAPIPADEYRFHSRLKGEEHFSDHELTWTYFALVDEGECAKKFDNNVVGVCGHIHRIREGLLEPRMYDNYIYVDTGCGCHPTAPLSAVEVTTKTVIAIWPEKT